MSGGASRIHRRRALPVDVSLWTASPSLVAAWLWIGLACLLLVELRARLPTLGHELVLLWALEDVWASSLPAGLTNWQTLLLVNPLLVVLLWAACRSEIATAGRGPIGGALRRLVYLGTSLLLLILQWALVSVGNAAPGWSVTRLV